MNFDDLKVFPMDVNLTKQHFVSLSDLPQKITSKKPPQPDCLVCLYYEDETGTELPAPPAHYGTCHFGNNNNTWWEDEAGNSIPTPTHWREILR